MIYPNNFELTRSIDKLLLGIIALNDLRQISQQKHDHDAYAKLRQSLALIFEDAIGYITASNIIEIQNDSIQMIHQGTRYGNNTDIVIDSQNTGLLRLRFTGSSMNQEPSVLIIDPSTVSDLQIVCPSDN